MGGNWGPVSTNTPLWDVFFCQDRVLVSLFLDSYVLLYTVVVCIYN